jgi:hypothetical protein
MKVKTQCEFGYELQLVIPYAYYLHTINDLEKTISSKMTRELYYFSNDHSELYKNRIFENPDVPNRSPHIPELDYSQYLPPPYKSVFTNSLYSFDKPLLIIHNKYTYEWNNPPINFIDIATLDKIFEYCNNKYKIVYINPSASIIVTDHSHVLQLEGETAVLNKYAITLGSELYSQTKDIYKINNFNHFQLLLHSNCERFISVQGGNSVLASYFGGTNIIYAKRGAELECNSYNTHYKKYSGCNIFHASTYDTFLNHIYLRY